jgi:hypothetical protein
MVGGSVVYQPLDFVLNHECTAAVMTTGAGDTYTYTVLSNAATQTLTSFSVVSQPTTCFTFSVLKSDGVTPATNNPETFI